MRGGETAERPERDRVVATEHDRHIARAHRRLDQIGDRATRGQDLREIPGALVGERRGLGHGRRDVPTIRDDVPDRREPLDETRVADRGRPHVDATSALSEVEGSADDGDRPCSGRVHGCERRRSGGTLTGRGEVAQLVEHTAENRGVAGSSPALATVLVRRSGIRGSGSPIAKAPEGVGFAAALRLHGPLVR